MTFAEKLDRLIQESGWSMTYVAHKLGRPTNQQVLRWTGRAGSGRPPKTNVPPKKDGTPRKKREQVSPGKRDLIGLSELFGVDIRWLIDDDLGWDDRLKADSNIIAKIRRTTADEQLEMWEWHIQKRKNGPTGWPTAEKAPDSKPEPGPTRKWK